jgi:uncharacterized protein (TIGR02271 family)
MANDYLRDQNVQQSSLSSNRIVAFFEDKDNAYSAIRELKDAGFTSDQIGLATREDQGSDYAAASDANLAHTSDANHSGHQGDNKSMWQEIKDFFTGSDNEVNNDEYTRTDFRNSVGGMNWNDDRTGYYQSGIAKGGAIVTVLGTRTDEARRILEDNDGDLRDTGFGPASFAGTEADSDISGVRNEVQDRVIVADRENVDRDLYASQDRNVSDYDRDQRIQLRGELLRTHKERVQRGEVRLRKEVVTENQSINVPVTREELVIERSPGSQQAVSGEIKDYADNEELRVPLSEEQVRVDKQAAVNEEVRVGKRQVQNTQQVQDTVRHEELRIDKDGDVEVDDPAVTKKRKKPAA